MDILRRLLLTLCGTALGFTLVATAWAHVGVATIGNRNTVKAWLNESGFYDHVVDTVLESANEQQAKEGQAQIPANDPQVQAIAKDAFSPGFLQENVEKFLDGTYAWLEGKTPKPEFVIDLASAKQQLAEGLGNYAAARAASLPACTLDQIAAMQDSFDALNAPCLPPGVDPTVAAAKLKDDIMTSDGFLADTTFSGEDLKVTENGQEVNISDSQFRRAQTTYKLAGYGPYIFGILSVLLALAVLFLSASKRRGVRRLGIILIASGVVVGLFWLAFNRSSSWLDSWARNLSGETSAGRELAAGLVRVINQDISSLLLWYAIGFTALGVAAVLLAAFYKRGERPEAKQPAEPEPPVDDSPKAEPKPVAKPDKKPPRKIQL